MGHVILAGYSGSQFQQRMMTNSLTALIIIAHNLTDIAHSGKEISN